MESQIELCVGGGAPLGAVLLGLPPMSCSCVKRIMMKGGSLNNLHPPTEAGGSSEHELCTRYPNAPASTLWSCCEKTPERCIKVDDCRTQTRRARLCREKKRSKIRTRQEGTRAGDLTLTHRDPDENHTKTAVDNEHVKPGRDGKLFQQKDRSSKCPRNTEPATLPCRKHRLLPRLCSQHKFAPFHSAALCLCDGRTVFCL